LRRRQPARAGLAAASLACALLASPVPSAVASTGFYIRGGGNGHGIGMSQYGSYGYALHGKRYRWILAHYYRGTSIGHVSTRRTVRVLLATGLASVAGATKAPGKRLKAGTTYTARPNADGTIALLTPSGKKVGTFRAPLTITGPGPLQLAGHGAYRGALEFRPDGSGGIETVNVVALEDYVRDVISAEMPASWPRQALEVQAVAARTYAITSDVGGGVFDLYPDTRSQMYGGVAAETPATDAAVASTRGQVVTYKRAPVVTYFFASSGGYTENVENVWPGSKAEPWLRGVADRYDGAGGDPYHRWGRELTVAGAEARLGGLLKGSLIGIRVTKHGVSPRIISAEVVGTSGRTTVTGSQLQRAFGLLSTYASFTTIKLESRSARTAALSGLDRPRRRSALFSLLGVLRAVIAATTPMSLHGSVFPAPRSGTVAIQLERGHRWVTVARAPLGAGGTFAAGLARAGTYRVAYAGIAGPSVAVP
jgi:stage II sporulation protein D